MTRLVIASPGGRLGGGGMGTVTRSMAEWIEETAPDMKVFVLDPRGDGPTWHFPFFLIAACFQLVLHRWRDHADVLHLQISERGSFLRKGVLLFLGHLLGMKVVVHHHGAELIPFFDKASTAVRRIARAIVQGADRNIVLGHRMKSYICNEMGVPPDRVSVFYNATRDVQGPDCRPRRAAIVDTEEGRPIHLLLMANLSKRKGVSEFLQALALLRTEGLHLRATLAGGGEVERYRVEAGQLGLNDICRFTGWIKQDAAADLLQSADALVLPSYEEGLPMVILEALSASVPVVATPVGSIPEVLESEQSCLLVSPGNVLELADALRRIITDPGLRDFLSNNGRELFCRQFELNNYMSDMRKLYETL